MGPIHPAHVLLMQPSISPKLKVHSLTLALTSTELFNIPNYSQLTLLIRFETDIEFDYRNVLHG